MHDRGKILTGIVIFLGFMTFPIWYNLARGKATYRPDLEKPSSEKRCVESTGYMRALHMNLLNTWRDQFVREGERGRYYEVRQGGESKRFKMSLTGTCLGCHNKATFCDRCHDYVGVKPYCFDCHLIPAERAERGGR